MEGKSKVGETPGMTDAQSKAAAKLNEHGWEYKGQDNAKGGRVFEKEGHVITVGTSGSWDHEGGAHGKIFGLAAYLDEHDEQLAGPAGPVGKPKVKVGDTVTAFATGHGIVHGKVTHFYPNGLTVVHDPKHGTVAVQPGDVGHIEEGGKNGGGTPEPESKGNLGPGTVDPVAADSLLKERGWKVAVKGVTTNTYEHPGPGSLIGLGNNRTWAHNTFKDETSTTGTRPTIPTPRHSRARSP